MARITVEDCIEKWATFELVLLAAHRGRVLTKGRPAVERKRDKDSVVALCEIAESMPGADLREA